MNECTRQDEVLGVDTPGFHYSNRM